MSDDQAPTEPSTEPEPPTGKTKSERFWQCFWLTFLVVSLAYAGYCFYAPSNRIAWAESYTTAQERAAESDKPMILFFTGKFCSPCQIMKRQVWADDQVTATVNGAFIPVSIDVGDPGAAEIVSGYEVVVTPTTIVTDSDGNVLQHRRGGMSRAEFLEMLGKVP